MALSVAPGNSVDFHFLQGLLELTPKNDVLLTIGDWNAKVGSQEIPSNRQILPWSAE